MSPTRGLGKTCFSKLSTSSPILFTCEHATGRIPPHLKRLGLRAADLKNCKDQYDPGALTLAKKLAATFKASLIWSDLSRLVVDMNRHFEAPSKHTNSYSSRLVKTELVTVRDGKEVFVPIPLNQTYTEKEERTLYDTVCVPYQKTMLKMIRALKKKHGHVHVISVHSFFPEYAGDIRTVDIDVMSDVDRETPYRVRDVIRKNSPNYTTEVDRPWSLGDFDGGAFYSLRNEPGVTVFAFDVKNDNLKNAAGIAQMAKALESGIRGITA